MTDTAMTDELIIRAVATTDFDQWLPLWNGYNAFYKRVGPTAISAEMTRTTWSRFFDAYEPMHALVAERDRKLVGLTHYIFHRHTSMYGPICYLQDLFTSAQARGQGVGRALINGVYDRAREAGSPRVYWQTHETNVVAQGLYDKVAVRSGFIVYRKTIDAESDPYFEPVASDRAADRNG
jgi:GNAT superfamily N-acetyltransferase